jgi:hypothetical protein
MGSRIVVAVVAALAAASLSGVVGADPRTPPAAPGQPAPFLGTAVIGEGGVTAAIDAYGDVVDLRWPGPAGQAEIRNPSSRQRVGSVPADTGVTLAASAGGDRPTPAWRGSRQRQRYLSGTDVLLTSGSIGGARVSITDAADRGGGGFVRRIRVSGPSPVRLRLHQNLDLGGDRAGDVISIHGGTLAQRDGARRIECRTHPAPAGAIAREEGDARATLAWRGAGPLVVELACSLAGRPAAVRPALAAAAASDRRWIARARPLAADAPRWAERMYTRSLLVLRALTDRRTGALAAGARDRWAYVWPRDAAAGALTLADAGYRDRARRVAHFLRGLRTGTAARFRGTGRPVSDGRPPAGDARGWIRAASRATGLPAISTGRWRDRGDYGEGNDGDFLGNAIAAGSSSRRIVEDFGTERGLVRRADDPGSGLDSSAAWAVEPFRRPGSRAATAATIEALAAGAGRYGIGPGQGWGGPNPWTAPTAWSAWALAALGRTGPADRLLVCLRRAATPAGILPERVDRISGIARSTAPLAWSHAFAALAIRTRWPPPSH